MWHWHIAKANGSKVCEFFMCINFGVKSDILLWSLNIDTKIKLVLLDFQEMAFRPKMIKIIGT